ncbi:MAG: DUF5320 domain-containing protein [Bacteroidales bacterium]|nr:DUF5320 domain-containing protein [Bacteroidales bacterium]
MPRFDRTGPNGEGAMTGRKNGLCTGNAGDMSQEGYGRGRGRGRGRAGRFGFGFRFGRGGGSAGRDENKNTVDSIRDEIEATKKHLSALEERLTKIKKQQ